MDGVVNSISGNVMVVNGQPMNIADAEIKGTPKVGAVAKVEGFLDASGVFIVTKIEFQNAGSDSGGGSDNSGSDDHSGDDNHGSGGSNDDNSNDNGGSNDDNSNDNGGSHSCSGGGGND